MRQRHQIVEHELPVLGRADLGGGLTGRPLKRGGLIPQLFNDTWTLLEKPDRTLLALLGP